MSGLADSLGVDKALRVLMDMQGEFSPERYEKNRQRLADLRREVQSREAVCNRLQAQIEEADQTAESLPSHHGELAYAIVVGSTRIREQLKQENPESLRHKIRELEKEQALHRLIVETLSKDWEI